MDIHPDRDRLAGAAAELLAASLAGPGPKALVVTGGSTPGPVYDRLAGRDLGWGEITVTLSDERWVEETSADSNARLVRQRLLTGRASAARFLPLKVKGATPDADGLAVEGELRTLPPWSAVLLGMGEDGHIASLFPGDPDLAARLDPDGARLCVGVNTAGLAPFVPRISLTVRALLRSRLLVLLITGQAKRALVERVMRGEADAVPAAAIVRQDRAPVRVLWAP